MSSNTEIKVRKLRKVVDDLIDQEFKARKILFNIGCKKNIIISEISGLVDKDTINNSILESFGEDDDEGGNTLN